MAADENWKYFREFVDVLNDHMKRTTANKLKMKGYDAHLYNNNNNIWTR